MVVPGRERDVPVPESPCAPTGVALAALAVAVAALVVSGVAPKDRGTWWMEVAPVLLALPVLVATWRRFPLTPLLYGLIAVHAVILCVGGHYTYAEVPLGFWVRDALGLARNHYDRLGHLAQGFVPALVAREVLLRTSPLRAGRWLAVIVTAVALAIIGALRARRVGRGAPPRPGRGRVPRDAGRPLGHAVGHAPRARRRDPRPGAPRARPGPPARAESAVTAAATSRGAAASRRPGARARTASGASGSHRPASRAARVMRATRSSVSMRLNASARVRPRASAPWRSSRTTSCRAQCGASEAGTSSVPGSRSGRRRSRRASRPPRGRGRSAAGAPPP